MSPDHLNRAEQACAELAASGQPITFTAVAARTGIGRASLYRNTAVRAVIEEQRRHAARATTLTALTADITALRTALEAVAARVRHHEEQLRHINTPPHQHPARTEPIINRPTEKSRDIGRLMLRQRDGRIVLRCTEERARPPHPVSHP